MGCEDDATLEEARDWLRERSAKGERCPCCRQYVKVYRRKLGGSMCRVLIAFYRCDRRDPGGWRNVFDVLKEDGIAYHGSDYGKLAYWGLLEQHEEVLAQWRITDGGKMFVQRYANVPSHAVIYDGRCLRLDGEPVSIIEALGKKFNYGELMAERPPSGEPS